METINLIKKALGLEREVIAFKFIPYKEEFDSSNSLIINSSFAEAVDKASLGNTYKMNFDTLTNDYDAYLLGLKQPPWEVLCGYDDYKLGKYSSYSIANSVAKARKYPNHLMYGAEIGPIDSIESPDLIIFICDAKTVMRIIQGYTRYYGVAKNLSTTATDGLVVDLISKVLSNNDINYSLFNKQDREDGNYLPGEMGVSIPANMLDSVIRGVLETVNLTENNKPKREILKRLDNPTELGFEIIMNYDYAIKASEYVDYCDKLNKKS